MAERRKLSKEQGIMMLASEMVSGLLVIRRAYRGKKMERLRYQALLRLDELDLEKGSRRAQKRRKGKVKKYMKRVQKAKSPKKLRKVEESFLDSFK